VCVHLAVQFFYFQNRRRTRKQCIEVSFVCFSLYNHSQIRAREYDITVLGMANFAFPKKIQVLPVKIAIQVFSQVFPSDGKK
jgi:hypothetical protein